MSMLRVREPCGRSSRQEGAAIPGSPCLALENPSEELWQLKEAPVASCPQWNWRCCHSRSSCLSPFPWTRVTALLTHRAVSRSCTHHSVLGRAAKALLFSFKSKSFVSISVSKDNLSTIGQWILITKCLPVSPHH